MRRWFYHQSNSRLCFPQEWRGQRPEQETYEEAAGMGCENNYVQFNGRIYRQVDGVAMGSPIAPPYGWRVHELRYRSGLGGDTVAIWNPERNVRKASHRASKQQ